jgi:hypothetical protein
MVRRSTAPLPFRCVAAWPLLWTRRDAHAAQPCPTTIPAEICDAVGLFGGPQSFIFGGALVSLRFPPAQHKSANGGQQEQCEGC